MMTHYTDAESRMDRFGNTKAVCGERVNEKSPQVDLQAPTCPKCAAILKARDEEPLPAWARV